MTNKGIEIMLNMDILRKKDFSWNMSLNLAHNKNEITKLSSDVYTTSRLYTGDPWLRGRFGRNLTRH